MNNKALLNSAFVGYEEFRRSRRVDNTLHDLQNSSYPTKAEFNNCQIFGEETASSSWNLEMLVFVEEEKPENPEKNP